MTRAFADLRRGAKTVLAWLVAARGPLLWACFVAAVALLGYRGLNYTGAVRQDRIIEDLAAGRDVPVDLASASDAVLLARAYYLLVRDRLDEAQTLVDVSAPRMDAGARATLNYNLANARVRLAIGAIEQGTLDRAIALVNLAKASYRQTLRIAPSSWDARYNLDVAMRLVRDLPLGEDVEDDKPKEKPKELWTDLPGTPKGLP